MPPEGLDFAAFHGSFHAGRDIPLHGSIELTHRCNLVCDHCYIPMTHDRRVRDATRVRDAVGQELTTAEWKRVLDDAMEAGCIDLLLTGGDPMLRRDFLELYRHAREGGCLVSVFTNATLVTEEIADTLAALPPTVVEVTLYGNTAASYEALTRLPGSYERCIRGLRLLVARGVPVKLKTVPLHTNAHELEGMRRFARSLDLPFKFSSDVFPMTDGRRLPASLLLDPDAMAAIAVRDPVHRELWGLDDPPPDEAGCPSEPGRAVPGDVFRCRAGRRAFSIDPAGQMQFCLMLRHYKFDMRRMSFRAAWERIREVRSMQRTRPSRCDTCALRPYCAVCPARSFLETGDLERPGDDLCRRTYAVGKALGRVSETLEGFLAARHAAEEMAHAG